MTRDDVVQQFHIPPCKLGSIQRDGEGPPLVYVRVRQGWQPCWLPYRYDTAELIVGDHAIEIMRVMVIQWRSWRWVKWLQAVLEGRV